MPDKQTIAVTGATGRLGRLLRLVWSAEPPAGIQPLWLVRRMSGAPDEMVVDLGGSAPVLPRNCIILHLAGTVAPSREMSDHVALARAALDLAIRSEARHLFFASTAAVYGKGEWAHDENEEPAPVTAYGHMKLAAEKVVSRPGTTCLRIGNVAGADAILGSKAERLVLDPVPGTDAGPVRSYIGPRTLVRVLEQLVRMVATGVMPPPILNIAQTPPVGMAELLRATGQPFEWGPDNPAVLPRVELATERLRTLLTDLPSASADGLVAERVSLPNWQP
jgi:nucleoside-diphosphate-sugar epimerase